MAEPVVYFIQAVGGGPIKVGIALNVEERLRKLQMGNWEPLRVIATMPGGRAEEQRIHATFEHLHVHGEWHTPGDDLLAWMREHATPFLTYQERLERTRWWRSWCEAWLQIGRAHAHLRERKLVKCLDCRQEIYVLTGPGRPKRKCLACRAKSGTAVAKAKAKRRTYNRAWSRRFRKRANSLL